MLTWSFRKLGEANDSPAMRKLRQPCDNFLGIPQATNVSVGKAWAKPGRGRKLGLALSAAVADTIARNKSTDRSD